MAVLNLRRVSGMCRQSHGGVADCIGGAGRYSRT